MLRINRPAFFTFFLIFTLCLSLMNTQLVLADDAPPPTQEALTEEAPTEVALTEQAPTEEAPTEQTPTEEVGVEESTPEPSTEEETSEIEEDISIAEVLVQAPDSTVVLVLDENGE